MKRVTLGDVVKRVRDKVDKDNTELEYYVAGEHFESGALTIYNRGIIEGSTIGPAFHMRFKPEHVLLMSRNPHLKKASTVNFEGICSNVSYVLETKNEEILLQEYLPFVLQDDSFWIFAEANKKGSTNFFLNWSDFEKYEFLLPSIDEQKKLADILWAYNETKEKYKELLDYSDKIIKAKFIKLFGDPVENSMIWPVKPLGELGKLKNGMNFKAGDTGFSIKSVGVGDFKDHTEIRDFSEISEISLSNLPSDDCMLQNGDLIFVRSNGNKELVGRCIAVYPNEELVTYSGFCIRFRKESSEVTTCYLNHFMRNDSAKRRLLSGGRGCNITNLNQKMLSSQLVPIPNIELQNKFEEFINYVEESKTQIKYALNKLEHSKNTLLKDYFKCNNIDE